MKVRKDIKLGRREKFVEDIRDDYTRCPKCGGILIIILMREFQLNFAWKIIVIMKIMTTTYD